MRTKLPNARTRADYYRQMAQSLRERVSTLKVFEARNEFRALAAEYERLADFLQRAELCDVRPRPELHRRNSCGGGVRSDINGRVELALRSGTNSINRPQDTELMPTEPVFTESDLRSRVLQRIEDGRLPFMLSTNIEAGYGAGGRCDLCDHPIAPDKIEYAVQRPRGAKCLHFHFACHSAWQRECVLRWRDLPRPSTQS